VGDTSHTEVDTVDLARWGREASLVGEDLSVALSRSGQQIALCSKGFGELSGDEFGHFVTALDGRSIKLVGALDGLATGLTSASVSYESVDDGSAATMSGSSPARLRL
jgi:hypothetical protein